MEYLPTGSATWIRVGRSRSEFYSIEEEILGRDEPREKRG